MRTLIAAGMMVALAGAYSGRTGEDQVQSRPGPGSGIVTVAGKVEVTSLPPISATQLGVWKVSLDEASRLQIAPPTFARPDTRYRVTWPNGDAEIIQVRDVSAGTWVLTTGGDRPRWINLAVAREVEVNPDGAPGRLQRP